MLKIRDDQYQAFARQAMLDFEAKAVGQLREGHPEKTAGVPGDALLARVRSAVGRAGRYGLKAEGEVVFFFNAAVLVGDDKFDENPAFPWAKPILTGGLAPAKKAEAVFDAAVA